jgi:hypothetical protein
MRPARGNSLSRCTDLTTSVIANAIAHPNTFFDCASGGKATELGQTVPAPARHNPLIAAEGRNPPTLRQSNLHSGMSSNTVFSLQATSAGTIRC